MPNSVTVDGLHLTLDDVVCVAVKNAPVQLSEDARARISTCWKVVLHAIRDKRIIYGITTMFGNDTDRILSEHEIQEFNQTVLIQHATSLDTVNNGEEFKKITRGAWLILLNGFAHGKSSVRIELIDEILKHINTDQVPYKNIEINGSIGAADLIPLAQMGMHLLKNDFKLDAGEALALMSSNAVSLSRAVFAIRNARDFLANATLSVAFTFEGLRANPSPFSETVSRSTANPYKQKISADLRKLMEGSALMREDTPKGIQAFLSLRDTTEILGALQEALDNAEKSLLDDMNAHQGNPVIDGTSIVSTSNYDTTRSTNAILSVINAIGTIVQTSENRSGKQIDRKFSGLASGLSSNIPGRFDGIYTRNLPYWLCSLTRSAMNYTTSSLMLSRFGASCSVGESIEDYNSPLPHMVANLESLIPIAQQVVAIEALYAVCAINRRKDQLKVEDLSPSMQNAYHEFAKTSPFNLDDDVHYSLKNTVNLYLNREVNVQINPLIS